MIRRCYDWLRIVLPSMGSMVFTILLGLVLIEGTYLWIFLSGWPVDQVQYLHFFRLGWLSCCAGAYGIYRAAACHPLCDRDYRQWLQSTPWTLDKPLLSGPPWPVLQDVVVILFLVALNHDLTGLNLIIPIGFLTCYLIANAVLNWMTGEWQLAYVVAFAMTSLPLLHAYWEYFLLVDLACLPIAYWATRRSLRRFPWSLSKKLERHLLRSAKEAQAEDLLGWPFEQLSPKEPQVWISQHDGICLSLLLGWAEFTFFTMLYALSPYFKEPLTPSGVMFGVFPVCLSAFITWGTIYGNHWSPISIWGRIRTGRWIIPAFDKMAVMPLCAVVVALLLHLTWRVEFAATGTAIAFLMLLVFSPNVEEWWLSGEHRLVFTERLRECVHLQ